MRMPVADGAIQMAALTGAPRFEGASRPHRDVSREEDLRLRRSQRQHLPQRRLGVRHRVGAMAAAAGARLRQLARLPHRYSGRRLRALDHRRERQGDHVWRRPHAQHQDYGMDDA